MTQHRWYVLKGKTAVRNYDTDSWVKFMSSDRVLARDWVGHVLVNTLFLGINQRESGRGRPLLFETMQFGPYDDEYLWLTSTYDEAMETHRRVVQSIHEANDATVLAITRAREE